MEALSLFTWQTVAALARMGRIHAFRAVPVDGDAGGSRAARFGMAAVKRGRRDNPLWLSPAAVPLFAVPLLDSGLRRNDGGGGGFHVSARRRRRKDAPPGGAFRARLQ